MRFGWACARQREASTAKHSLGFGAATATAIVASMTDPLEPAPIEHIDLEALDLGHMARHARTATFAPNWKSVLAADGSVGLVILALGFGAVAWLGWPGWFLVVAGLVYVLLVGRRALQWRWLRAQAGL